MPFNGSGTFTPARNFVADKAAGAPTNIVTASLVDQVINDLADGLEHCQTVNGETTIAANLPMSTFRHTGVGNAQARTDYASAGQVADGSLQYAGTSTGTDTIVCSLTPAITAYVEGMRIGFEAGGTNTGAATINVNSVGAIAVQKQGAALVAGDITAADMVVGVIRDVAATKTFQMVSPARTPVLTAGGIAGASVAAATETTRGTVELATDAETITGTDTGRAVTPANVAAAYQGLQTIFIPAAAMKPTVSNGCAVLTSVETTSGRPDMIVLDFDDAADEHAQFQIAMPKSWDEGTITFQVWHTTTATDTDGVAWGLQGVACSDGDTIDVAYGTPVVVTDAYQSTAEDLYVTAVSSAVTIAGTPAAGDMCFFRIFRDVSDAADTATEDARLIGVQLLFTVNAGNDA
jgi:hypothetical protein